MRPELERLHRIECHLQGRPQPVAAPAWEIQRLLDAELDTDAEAQRQLYAGIRQAGRRQLRRELDAIHKQLYPPRAGWLRRLLRW
jgi:hypothetical protein